MKAVLTFVAGVIAGCAVTYAAFSLRRNESPRNTRGTSTVDLSATENPRAPQSPAAPPSPMAARSSDEARLQRSIQLLREAGMVVMRQETAIYFTPSLKQLSADDPPGESAIREGLQLDDREISALQQALYRLTERLAVEASRRLAVVETGQTYVHCEVPAFPTERSQLIAAARDEMLAAVDAESRGLLQQINDERAFAFLATGAAEATLTVRLAANDDTYSISVKTPRGHSVLHTRLPEIEVIRLYPALRGRLPRAEHP